MTIPNEVDRQGPPRKPPAGELPPVEPPTVGFILQLFVIPMVIVTIIVVVWLLFNWLAHMGSNPTELVRELKKLNDASWQKALTLADLLRNPQNEHLKKDPVLAKELSDVLLDQIKDGSLEENPIQLRVFLCRALGEFQFPEVLPTLLEAARTQRAAEEVQVRRSALQALAVYISNNDPSSLRQDKELAKVLVDASRESGSSQDFALAELRSTAAFALGMLGGDEALDRLDIMLGEAYSNARYNAAIALCRHGDLRAMPVLLEMLDPNNEAAVEREQDKAGIPWKRLLVMQNGIRAASQLVEKNKSEDIGEVAKALEVVSKSELTKFNPNTRRGIRIEAENVLFELRNKEGDKGKGTEGK